MYIPQSFQAAGPLGLGGPEVLVILGIAVLLFGGKKIPEVAKGIGEGIKSFKSAMKEEDPQTPPAAPAEPKKS